MAASSSPKLFNISDHRHHQAKYIGSLDPRSFKSNLINGSKRISTHLTSIPIARPIFTFKRYTPLSLIRARKQNASITADANQKALQLFAYEENKVNTNDNNITLSDKSSRFFDRINLHSTYPGIVTPSPTRSRDAWEKTGDDNEIEQFKNKIMLLDKQLIDANIQISRMKVENELHDGKTKSELESKQQKIDEFDQFVKALQEKEAILCGNIEQLKQDNLIHANRLETQEVKHIKEMAKLRGELQSVQHNESKTRASMYSEGTMLKRRVETLQNELDRATKEVKVYTDKLQEMVSAQQEIAQLKSDLEATQAESQELKDQIGCKSELEAELVEMQTELCEVKNQLDMVRDDEKYKQQVANQKEIDQLLKMIAEKDALLKANERLVEERLAEVEAMKAHERIQVERFKIASKVFRETTYCISGWLIEKLSDTRFMFTHADDTQRRRLLFDLPGAPNNQSQRHMLAQDDMSPATVASFREKIQTYLSIEHPSISAFLASISLDLFHDKQLRRRNAPA